MYFIYSFVLFTVAVVSYHVQQHFSCGLSRSTWKNMLIGIVGGTSILWGVFWFVFGIIVAINTLAELDCTCGAF